MGRSRFKFHETAYPYFVTCTIQEGINLFSDPLLVQIVLDSLEFIQNSKAVKLYAYVIMENHLHAIMQSDKPSEDLQSFKSFTAKKIIESLEKRGRKYLLKKLRFYKKLHKHQSKYQVWQEGAHPKQIDSLEKMVRTLSYIHNNPVKAGFVDDPVHWRYSSARDYQGLVGLISISLFEG